MSLDPELLMASISILGSPEGLEGVILFLRRRGLSKIATIRALTELTNMSLKEAKTVVHNSSAWADVYLKDEEFLNSLVGAIEAEAGRACDTSPDDRPSSRSADKPDDSSDG